MDAYQGSTSDPMSLHKYLFANANPVMNSDPSGYEATAVELEASVYIQTKLAVALNALNQTAIAVFNAIAANIFTVIVSIGGPIAMFVGNNPAFIEICLRFANGEIRLDTLRDYLLDLYNQFIDKVVDFIDEVTGNKSSSNNSSSNGSSGNTQPPQNPIDPNKLHHIFDNLEHGLNKFLDSFGGNKEEAFRAIEEATQKYVNQNNITGEIEDIVLNINGYDITVRGYVIDGVAKIGTAFVP